MAQLVERTLGKGEVPSSILGISKSHSFHTLRQVRRQQYHRMNPSRIMAATALVALPLMSVTAVAEDQAAPRHLQRYAAADLFAHDVERAGGGQGTLYGQFAFRREQAQRQDALREIGWMTLRPGAYIGLHPHTDSEDAYLIISGRGVFLDGTGQAWVAGPGDVTIARPGQSHALANLFDEDLVFIDIIAANEAALRRPAEDAATSLREKYKALYPWLAAADAGHDRQYYAAAEMQEHNREHARQGEGMFLGRYAFYHEAARPTDALQEIARITLPPGAAIGNHRHEDEENAYVFLTGTGTYTDNEGRDHEVGPGSVTLAGPRQSHALRNTGTGELVFINILARNEVHP